MTDRIQALLLDRNRIARMVLRVDPRGVDRAIATAALLAAEPLLGNPAALGIERIELSEEMLRIMLREQTLLQRLEIEADEERESSIQLEANIKRVRRGHELRLVVAGDSAPAAPPRQRDERLVGIIAESLQARAMMLSRPERSINETATSQQRCRKRLDQLVRLSFIAPDIVQIILRGEQPPSLTYAKPLDAELPVGWQDQRLMLEIV